MASARLVILALLVAGCQSWKLPAVPAGRRAQFYTQQNDGAYKYGFDTAEGLYQVQEGNPANEVVGVFGADGGKVAYTAGVNGFVVTEHQKADTPAVAVYKSAKPIRFATVEELNTPPKPVEDTPEVVAAKATFKAAYDAAAAAAEAAPDTDIITGAVPVIVPVPAPAALYSAPATIVRYTGPLATLDAEGNVLETAEVKAAKVQFQAVYDAAAAAAAAAPDVNIITGAVPVVVQAGPAPVVAAVTSEYKAPVEVAHVRASASEDGSYAFSYETSDSARHESADAANNVKGSYEFVAADDAQRRRVAYSAGAETGFLASGAHLPVAVADTAEVAAAKASFKTAYESAAAAAEAAADDPIDYSAADVAVAPAAAVFVAPASTYFAPAQPVITATYTSEAKPADIVSFKSTSNVDGSYAFSYETSDSARHESADAANNVKGSYEFVAADDAQRRRVAYSAGAETGFLVSGAHLPVAVADTAEVAAAKASFKTAYESAAAAAEAAADDPISYDVAPPVYTAPVITSAAAPVVSVRYATLEELNTLPKAVQDTAEVAAAKATFKAQYDAAAALAEAAPDTDIITGAVPVIAPVPAPAALYAAPATIVRYTGPLATLDAEGNVLETAEVKAAKAQFLATYDAVAAAAAAAPDVNIVTAPVTAIKTVSYSASAPATILASAGPVVTLDAAGNVQDTAEVAAAKATFKAQYDAAAALAEAAPDTDIITGAVNAVKAAGYSSSVSQAAGYKASHHSAHHGDTLTYSFDGITVMQADGASSPLKYGYTYE